MSKLSFSVNPKYAYLTVWVLAGLICVKEFRSKLGKPVAPTAQIAIKVICKDDYVNSAPAFERAMSLNKEANRVKGDLDIVIASLIAKYSNDDSGTSAFAERLPNKYYDIIDSIQNKQQSSQYIRWKILDSFYSHEPVKPIEIVSTLGPLDPNQLDIILQNAKTSFKSESMFCNSLFVKHFHKPPSPDAKHLAFKIIYYGVLYAVFACLSIKLAITAAKGNNQV